MYDQQLIASIKKIGDLRQKPNYYQSLVDLFATEVTRCFASFPASAADCSERATLDLEDGWRTLHRLKGSASSIGAVAVANSCHALIGNWQSALAANVPPTEADAQIEALEKQCREAIHDMRGF